MSQQLICGFDEVGRGSLAGPLIAVGALFPSQDDFLLHTSPIPGLKDSKKFSSMEARRKVFNDLVRSQHLIDFGIGIVWTHEINRVGIDEANALAFYYALDALAKEPDFLLVDGDKPVRHFQRAFQRVEARADGKYWPVAAASILAKVIRDELMMDLHGDFPAYSWDQNKGYGSDEHREAIRQHGPCSLHRKHFLRSLLNAKPNGLVRP
jgi:ribonuclease HII